ncbi:MAG: DUF364 domain-containing protein [Treponema sp.]|jgi:uncharacterized protein (DUF4213/DUF364 family)|nr:DUF364 domain-containing protein [Treponema sp.]
MIMKDSKQLWALYDALITPIPPERRVDEVIPGGHWTMVRSGKGAGLAMTIVRPPDQESRPRSLPPVAEGIPLRELAEAVKSWNFAESSLGAAAINAYWNSPEHPAIAKALEYGSLGAFETYRSRVAGKKVAVIGHFRHIERTLEDVCELSILEKRPQADDYPDSACEFLLPFQDFVFATGVTFINKTLPRLLEIAAGIEFIMVGPSVPLCPLLFDFGIRDLQGFTVTDPDLLREIAGGKRPDLGVFDAGKRVSISAGLA